MKYTQKHYKKTSIHFIKKKSQNSFIFTYGLDASKYLKDLSWFGILD